MSIKQRSARDSARSSVLVTRPAPARPRFARGARGSACFARLGSLCVGSTRSVLARRRVGRNLGLGRQFGPAAARVLPASIWSRVSRWYKYPVAGRNPNPRAISLLSPPLPAAAELFAAALQSAVPWLLHGRGLLSFFPIFLPRPNRGSRKFAPPWVFSPARALIKDERTAVERFLGGGFVPSRTPASRRRHGFSLCAFAHRRPGGEMHLPTRPRYGAGDAIAGSLIEFCARAATFGEDVSSSFMTPPALAGDGDGRSGGASRRRSANPLDRTQVNLVSRAVAPTSLFIAPATGAHQPLGLGAPDQGADQGPMAFGPFGAEEIILTVAAPSHSREGRKPDQPYHPTNKGVGVWSKAIASPLRAGSALACRLAPSFPPKLASATEYLLVIVVPVAAELARAGSRRMRARDGAGQHGFAPIQLRDGEGSVSGSVDQGQAIGTAAVGVRCNATRKRGVATRFAEPGRSSCAAKPQLYDSGLAPTTRAGTTTKALTGDTVLDPQFDWIWTRAGNDPVRSGYGSRSAPLSRTPGEYCLSARILPLGCSRVGRGFVGTTELTGGAHEAAFGQQSVCQQTEASEPSSPCRPTNREVAAGQSKRVATSPALYSPSSWPALSQLSAAGVWAPAFTVSDLVGEILFWFLEHQKSFDKAGAMDPRNPGQAAPARRRGERSRPTTVSAASFDGGYLLTVVARTQETTGPAVVALQLVGDDEVDLKPALHLISLRAASPFQLAPGHPRPRRRLDGGPLRMPSPRCRELSATC
nr:unnamed protein product [Digitaria exilis]